MMSAGALIKYITRTPTNENGTAHGKNRCRSFRMDTSASLHRPERTPERSRIAVGTKVLRSKARRMGKPVRGPSCVTTTTATEAETKTSGCPIHEIRRANVVTRQRCARSLRQSQHDSLLPETSPQSKGCRHLRAICGFQRPVTSADFARARSIPACNHETPRLVH